MGSPRVVIASEMGGGWGHLLPLRAIADEFIDRGCEVVVLAREAEKARTVFSPLGVEVVPSPAWEIQKTGFSLNYAQCVWGNGYWDRRRFLANLSWWRERFSELRPRFVLADFAPTALLAARASDLPRGAVGTGFTLPPLVIPTPSLHPWLKPNGKALAAAAEELLIATVRDAVPVVDSVAGIFAGAGRFLTIFPEFDHFAERPCERYWGPVLHGVAEGAFDWPAGKGPRVFLYLGAGNRCLKDLLDHLRRLGLPVVGHIRGLPDSERRALESRALRLSASLLDLDRAASECDIAVTQGGLHTTAWMLLAGVRLLLCPEQLEQALLAYRLNQQGLCEWVGFWSDPGRVQERFDVAVSSETLGESAAAFSARYAGYDSSDTVAGVVRECLEAAG